MPLIDILLFVLGLVLLMAGAEGLVRGASRLAQRLGIPAVVVGLTVVALGTSAPETAVSVQSAFSGEADLALGNVVGSNITNVLLILGFSALVAPLAVSARLVRLDVPIMIGASVLTFMLCRDRRLDGTDGVILLGVLVAYLYFLIQATRRGRTAIPVEDVPEVRGTVATDLVYVVVGLALLVLGSRWLVNSAVAFAELLGVSRLVIGLTVVAVGTSLPELATSVMATIRGERDIAVGNVVGSNLFNLLFVLGSAATVSPEAITVPEVAMAFDFPVMLAASAACLPIFFTGHSIERWEGGLFFLYYVAYVVYLVMSSTQNFALPIFHSVMFSFVIPLTVVTLVLITWREARSRRRQKGGAAG